MSYTCSVCGTHDDRNHGCTLRERSLPATHAQSTEDAVARLQQLHDDAIARLPLSQREKLQRTLDALRRNRRY